jgi:Flp pilus assembly protein TadD
MYTSWLAEIYRMQGRYEEAAKEAQKALELDPKHTIAHFVLGYVHLDRGRYDEAIVEIQKAAAVSPRWKWVLGPMYAVAGRGADARRVLAELKQQKVDRWVAHWLARTHAALGEKDEAFRWLNIERPHFFTPWLLKPEWPAEVKPIRDDPRFRELQIRMHVPQR